MKLEVYSEDEEEDKTVRLRFLEYGGGNFIVTVVDKRGNRLSQGDLIWFNKDGTIHRETSVNPDLGFQLDKDGRIKLDEE